MKQHNQSFLELVAESKKRIREVTPQALKKMMDENKNMCVIDVREDSEWPSGHIAGAIHISKGVIERDIQKKSPDANTTIVTYCSGGFRCALVADVLQNMGYKNVYSLETGLSG